MLSSICSVYIFFFLFYFDGSLSGLILNIFLSIFFYLSLDVTLLLLFKYNIFFNNIYSFDGFYFVYFTLNGFIFHYAVFIFFQQLYFYVFIFFRFSLFSLLFSSCFNVNTLLALSHLSCLLLHYLLQACSACDVQRSLPSDTAFSTV